MEYVLLVDEQDNELGVMEKLLAHQEAKLHRAISVFVFNQYDELLLQRRAQHKYHSGYLWTNTCCTHPRPNELLEVAAVRRLQEEMGISCSLEHQFSFLYKASLDNDLTEHELDHVFFGISNNIPKPNPDEVSDWKYMDIKTIETEIMLYPDRFTEWFKLIFEKIKELRK
jgi:isopentenyl-diphosphate Delta-isomerase